MPTNDFTWKSEWQTLTSSFETNVDHWMIDSRWALPHDRTSVARYSTQCGCSAFRNVLNSRAIMTNDWSTSKKASGTKLIFGNIDARGFAFLVLRRSFGDNACAAGNLSCLLQLDVSGRMRAWVCAWHSQNNYLTRGSMIWPPVDKSYITRMTMIHLSNMIQQSCCGIILYIFAPLLTIICMIVWKVRYC